MPRSIDASIDLARERYLELCRIIRANPEHSMAQNGEFENLLDLIPAMYSHAYAGGQPSIGWRLTRCALSVLDKAIEYARNDPSPDDSNGS